MLLQILQNTIGISILHKTIDILFKSKHTNTTTCMLVQTYYMFMSFYGIFLEFINYDKILIVQRTTNNLLWISGYFCYDILYLIFFSPSFIFIVHHIVSLLFLYVTLNIEVLPEICIYYNIFAIAIEGTSPLINLKPLSRGTEYEQINKFLIFVVYTLLRVILHPIVYIPTILKLKEFGVLSKSSEYFYYVKFFGLYLLSLFWYRGLLKYAKCKND